ncbi:MAG TPA: thiol:disulfide interchange protein DsbA/DsbL [Burkholderiales bacterium]|jgi:thiol:disulfide interchange protein DsbA|nr:thiol:disulfide interchange protein DsbA/DsbL [Burkholderiales bacterium]
MKLLLAALFAAALHPGSALGEPIEGVEYERLDPPRPSAAPDRIEVVEFFYYGCESCDRFDPKLGRWLEHKPQDVHFRRVPAIRRTDWIPLTRLFFVLEELGALPRLHSEVYRAVHAEGRDFRDRKTVLDWGQSKGLDRAALDAALDSDVIRIKVEKARDTTIAYDVRTTPTLVVDGRYLTSAEMLGDIELLVPVLGALIDKVRRERAAAR